MIKRISLIFTLLFAGLSAAFAQTYYIDNGSQINTCSGILYDTGGAAGDYSNNESYTLTICSNSTFPIRLEFTTFDTEVNLDELSIYDGNSTAQPILINQASGTSLQGQTVSSTATCLTLEWTTDGSNTFPGFEANISCVPPCQNFDIDFVSSNPPLTNTDSMWIDICQGETIDFTVEGDYPNSGANYSQHDSTTYFSWQIDHGNSTDTVNGIGLTNFSYTFNDEGGYYITVTGTDQNGCTNLNLMQVRVRASITPVFSGVNVYPDTICIGDEVSLDGYNYVTPVEWEFPFQSKVADTSYLPDGGGTEYTSSITYSIFNPGQTVTSITDIQSICANIEHSWAGDLEAWIECPSGDTMQLFNGNTGGGADVFLGEPIDNNSNPVPGVGYDYCWDQASGTSFHDVFASPPTYTYTDNLGTTVNNQNYVPAGNYKPTGNWTELLGCPLNGSWTIHIIDNLILDNGYIFSWQLNIDPSLIPSNMWSIENEYDTTYSASNNDIYWTGENIISDTAGDGIAVPITTGHHDYILHAIDDFGCEYDTTVSMFVRPAAHPACCVDPAADAGIDDTVCSNTYTLSTKLDDTINTVMWSQVSGPGTIDFQGQQNSTDPTIKVDIYGTYEIEVMEQNLDPSCRDWDTVQITFRKTPNTQFNISRIDCFGDSATINYTGDASLNATYNWNFDGGDTTGNPQTPINVTWNTAGNHDITLSVEEKGCVSNDTVQTVRMPAELSYTLSSVDDPCYNTCEGSASINVSGGTKPFNYSWGGNNQIEDLCAGKYYITVTDFHACQINDSVIINEPPELQITDTSTSNVSCFNQDDGEIHLLASGGTGSLSYNWNDGGSGKDRINLSAGYYDVTVSDQNGCTTTQDFTLSQPGEIILNVPASQALCSGESLNLNVSASGGNGPYAFYWDSGNGFNSGSTMLNVSPDSTTVYEVYAQDQNGCQSKIKQIKVIVSPDIKFKLSTKNNTCYNSCDGEAKLQIIGGIPPFDYSWAADGNLLENICSGNYDITVTDMMGCTEDTSFYISQPPELIGNIFTKPATCHGEDDGLAFVEVTGGSPGYSYLWPDGTRDDSITTTAGNYEVTVTDTNDCRLLLDKEIQEPDRLKLINATGDKTICKSNSTKLLAQAIGGTPGYDFRWINTNTQDTMFINDPTVSPDTTTTYSVYVQDVNGCKTSKSFVDIKVYPDLSINNIITSYDSVCPGNPAKIEVDVSGGNGGPYKMTLKNGEIVPSPFTVYPQETRYYVITLNDACGTPAVKDSIRIKVFDEPDFNIVSDIIEGCPPLKVNFEETGNNSDYKYLWGFGDNKFSKQQDPVHVYQDSGYYNVKLSVTTDNGCEIVKKKKDMIYVYPNAKADFYPEPEYASINDPEITFNNISENSDSVYWYFNDGDFSIRQNPVHRFPAIGEYQVMLIAATKRGCKDTTYKTISIREDFTFFAPTAFTPNSDGDNDYFMVYGNGIDPNQFNLYIYNKWGEVVFDTDKYDPQDPVNHAWDGTKNGNYDNKGDELLPSGVYYWYCKYKDYNNIWHEEEGHVTLIR